MVETRHQTRLLAVLRDEGPMSRVELGERFELPRAKLTGEVARLVDAGLVGDRWPGRQPGRPTVHSGPLGRRSRFLGVDVGATSVTVAVTDARCEVLAHTETEDCLCAKVPCRCSGGSPARRRGARQGARQALGAGIGLPGPVSFRRGHAGRAADHARAGTAFRCATSCPALGLPGHSGQRRQRDGAGERHAGVARSPDDLIFVKIGTGIGCGIVLGGKVYRGVAGTAGRHRPHPARRLRPDLRLR